MRKVVFLMIGAVTVISMFVPVGPIGPQQVNASFAPVPEPSSLILLGAGFAGLARYLQKRP